MFSMKLYTSAVIFVSFILITAHIIAPDNYDWTQHTMSQLAAQGYSMCWVMQLGFIGFGALVLAEALRRLAYDPLRKFTEGPLIVCGVMFILSSIFSTRPFTEGIPYSEHEAIIHGTMSTLARIAVSVSMLSYAIIEKLGTRKILYVVSFVLVVGLNILMEIVNYGEGIVQRVLCVVVLTWFVFIDARQVNIVGQESKSFV
jgi:hypothetical membrane protein